MPARPACTDEPSPTEKLLQALDLMADGIALKRAAIRRGHPRASGAERRAILRAWLSAEPR